MGYHTNFNGLLEITPHLNAHEVAFLEEFNRTRRMARQKGPYYVKSDGQFGQSHEDDVLDFNSTGIAMKLDDTGNYVYGDIDNPPPEHGTPAQMPGLWCPWTPGTYHQATKPDEEINAIVWDEGEKPYDSAEWLAYLIDNFLRPDAYASTPEGQQLVGLAGETERFSHFTFDHICNGDFEAEGEESDDRWRIVVKNNVLVVQHATISYPPLPWEG